MQKPTDQATLFLLVGGGAGGMLAALLLVVFAVFLFSPKDAAEPANSPERASAAAARQPHSMGDSESATASQSDRIDTSSMSVEDQMAAMTNSFAVMQKMNEDNARDRGESPDIDNIDTKLVSIGRAFLYFSDKNRVLAWPRIVDQDPAKVLNSPRLTRLSWRVHLLPYLDQKPLYDRFHLDEDWDSPHNKTLIASMPDIYRVDSADKTTTRFQVVTGPKALFGRPKSPLLRDCEDGLRHTILALVTGPDRAVVWTQPDQLKLDESAPIRSLGTLPDRRIRCVMANGKPLTMRDDVAAADFFALTTPQGGEIADAEKMRREFAEQTRGTAGANAPRTPAQQVAVDYNARVKKLKQLVVAMHDYHDAYRQLPHGKNRAFYNQNGQPNLSWRVFLLRSLDQEHLYKQFKTNEPWDSPHNIKLAEKMPDVFRDPLDPIDSNKTRYQVFKGPTTPFPQPKGMSFSHFKDGMSQTLLIVAAGAEKAVPWTKPLDIEFDPTAPIGCLGELESPFIYYAQADGAVQVIRSSVPANMFKALITPSGGEKLPEEFKSFIVK